MAPETDAPSAPLRIEGEFTIFRAAELKPVLLPTPPLRAIDLSGVTEMDCAGLQLLMMAKRAAVAARQPLSLVGHSPAVLEVFELLNVAPYFDEPVVMARSRSGSGAAQTATKGRA